ncbi:hypothetical protein O181_011933 [Austropuccinia psidii MF-1]|uniref:Uncharacterized protein n=1 Tax=Austropuccinia psidii MF-1 TaxID=1389203 RepID=A0A9Q3BVT6_9BASI|nr:hypothetical protein [Austropuccinia psidii MF-1]
MKISKRASTLPLPINFSTNPTFTVFNLPSQHQQPWNRSRNYQPEHELFPIKATSPYNQYPMPSLSTRPNFSHEFTSQLSSYWKQDIPMDIKNLQLMSETYSSQAKQISPFPNPSHYTDEHLAYLPPPVPPIPNAIQQNPTNSV